MRTLMWMTVLMSVAVFFPMHALAQITVSSSDVNRVFSAGNIILNRTDTLVTSVDIGTPSGGNSWDFSGLSTHTGSVYNCVAAAGSPWVANFPGATHAVRVDTSSQGVNISVYQYLQLNSTGLRNLGNMGRATPFPFVTVEVRTTVTPVETISVLPAALTTTWHAGFTSNTLITLNGSTLSNETTTSNATFTVDGYGTMRLPGFTQSIFALRIRKLDFSDMGPILTFVFLSRGGAQVECEATDTSARSGIVSVRRGSVIWNTSVVSDSTTDVHANKSLPMDFALRQNYPNPFNPSTMITFDVAKTELVSLEVYNIVGQRVRTLVNEVRSPGTYLIDWTAENMPSGVYFCNMKADGFNATRRLVLLR